MRSSASTRTKATREEHQARMQRAEHLLVSAGFAPAEAARRLAAEVGCGERQAARYIKAIRAIYANAGDRPDALPTPFELHVILANLAAEARVAEKPDFKAAVQATELSMRARGFLDRKSTLTVQGTIGLQPLPALDRFDAEGLAMLAKLHEHMREREVKGELADAGVPADATAASVPLERLPDVEPIE